jgi:hypothetical protein
MTTSFEQIKDELNQTLPSGSNMLLPPYTEEDTLTTKLSKTYRILIRSIRTKNRKLALTNAYFLGLLLSEPVDITRKFKKENSKHYQKIAESVYDIFEFNSSHILVTTSIDVQRISKLKRNEILQLRQIVQDLKIESIFHGVQNLEEESC